MTDTENTTARPPVITIMGHIDHGKSTLLDYIRKTESVAAEAGGITQHLGAYEVVHNDRRITFLDTPGHEAFGALRSHGAKVADIAILIIAADDGLKTQTIEALKCIRDSGLHFVVAINKIDTPGADVERVKQELAEHEVFVEGYGGDVSFVPISAKNGDGVSDLLDILLLTADIADVTASPDAPASGVVIEANIDPKKGIAATLIIKDGTLKKGMYVVAGESIAPMRIMENDAGKTIDTATFSAPVNVIGFNTVPDVGAPFHAFPTKKEAEAAVAKTAKEAVADVATVAEDDGQTIVPIIIKADVLNSLDAIEYEIAKFETERVIPRVIQRSVGAITENDIRYAIGKSGTIVIGFNADIDARAKDLAERFEITVGQFSIIYELTQWLEKQIADRTPKIATEEVQGTMRVLKAFSKTKEQHVIGCRVESGRVTAGEQVRILRRGVEVGRGVVTNMQREKQEVKHVDSGSECGVQIKSKAETIAPGDSVESYIVTEK